jgi:hypothetical protein
MCGVRSHLTDQEGCLNAAEGSVGLFALFLFMYRSLAFSFNQGGVESYRRGFLRRFTGGHTLLVQGDVLTLT